MCTKFLLNFLYPEPLTDSSSSFAGQSCVDPDLFQKLQPVISSHSHIHPNFHSQSPDILDHTILPAQSGSSSFPPYLKRSTKKCERVCMSYSKWQRIESTISSAFQLRFRKSRGIVIQWNISTSLLLIIYQTKHTHATYNS
jgi:hypothetical protein